MTTLFLVALLSASALANTPETAPAADAPVDAALEVAPAAAIDLENLPPEVRQMLEFEASLDKQTGAIDLGKGVATFDTGERYVFLGPDDATRLLQAWGNPPGPPVLGVVLPAGTSVFDDASWAVIVEYSQEGYVDDSDAGSIDYDGMLADMQAEARADSEAREEAGYESVALIGWAEPPHYAAESHKLYWAKELAFGGSEEHTLNYNIRVLGRRGVLVMNAIANMGQLEAIRPEMEQVMRATSFKEGHRYVDFDPSMDEVAAYGIGALVAGTLATKAGLFKGLLALLLAGKKFVVLGVVGLLAAAKSLFGRGGDTPDAD